MAKLSPWCFLLHSNEKDKSEQAMIMATLWGGRDSRLLALLPWFLVLPHSRANKQLWKVHYRSLTQSLYRSMSGSSFQSSQRGCNILCAFTGFSFITVSASTDLLGPLLQQHRRLFTIIELLCNLTNSPWLIPQIYVIMSVRKCSRCPLKYYNLPSLAFSPKLRYKAWTNGQERSE
jgi:hypothetical protein